MVALDLPQDAVLDLQGLIEWSLDDSNVAHWLQWHETHRSPVYDAAGQFAGPLGSFLLKATLDARAPTLLAAGLVADVLEVRRVRLLQALAHLERRSGIVRAAGRTYRFDHHQIQEVLYSELPDELREEYHSLIAELKWRDAT